MSPSSVEPNFRGVSALARLMGEALRALDCRGGAVAVVLPDLALRCFVFTNGKKTFLSIWYSINPLYYTMKMVQDENLIIISSEILPHFKESNWSHIKNYSLLSIRTDDLFVQEQVL